MKATPEKGQPKTRRGSEGRGGSEENRERDHNPGRGRTRAEPGQDKASEGKTIVCVLGGEARYQGGGLDQGWTAKRGGRGGGHTKEDGWHGRDTSHRTPLTGGLGAVAPTVLVFVALFLTPLPSIPLDAGTDAMPPGWPRGFRFLRIF